LQHWSWKEQENPIPLSLGNFSRLSINLLYHLPVIYYVAHFLQWILSCGNKLLAAGAGHWHITQPTWHWLGNQALLLSFLYIFYYIVLLYHEEGLTIIVIVSCCIYLYKVSNLFLAKVPFFITEFRYFA
jgi:hypothetical protein